MSFDSLQYLIFLPITAVLHRFLPHRYRWVLLLCASICFYASWNLPLTLLLAAVIGVTYLSARLIAGFNSVRLRRITLAVSVMLCIGLLVYFKYFNFLLSGINGILGVFRSSVRFEPLDIILPVGISFYSFQALSYVLDVYRGTIRAERHFGYYALYVSFFPQLVAGPIERADRLLPQLKANRNLSRSDLDTGLRFLISGYFRKIVIADFCAIFVNNAYSLELPDGSAVFIGTFLFAFQIYCDFAGYSEIARGSARLLGIDLMQNFDRPYLARGIRDFWRRWHISLSRWFTDYVYIPMGGSRKGPVRQIIAIMTVFILSGLWHGADLSFLVWGLFHGLLMVTELLLARRFSLPKKKPAAIIAVVLNFCAVCFSWIFFRASDLSHAFLLIRRLFSPWDLTAGLSSVGFGLTELLWAAAAILSLPILHRLCEKREEKFSDMTYFYLIFAVIAAWLFRLSQNEISAFIYFQF